MKTIDEIMDLIKEFVAERKESDSGYAPVDDVDMPRGQYISEADARYSWQIPDDADLTCPMCNGTGNIMNENG